MDASRSWTEVKGRLARIVSVVAAVLKPLIVSGAIATIVIAAALAPWMFHSTGASLVWAVLVAIGVVATWRLVWHRSLLRRTLGSPAYLDEALRAVRAKGEAHYQRLSRELDGVLHADKGTRGRGALKVLANVRNLSALREMNELSDAVIEPINPQRMVITGYAAFVVVVASVLAVPIAVLSVLGLLLR